MEEGGSAGTRFVHPKLPALPTSVARQLTNAQNYGSKRSGTCQKLSVSRLKDPRCRAAIDGDRGPLNMPRLG